MKKTLLFAGPDDGSGEYVFLGRCKNSDIPHTNNWYKGYFFTVEVEDDYEIRQGSVLDHPYGWKIQCTDGYRTWTIVG